MRALYISYDGAMDPLGQSQIISYLVKLSKRGIEFTLLTYEKKERLKDENRRRTLGSMLNEKRIRWEVLPYHKSPTVPATTLDILSGVVRGIFIVLRDRIEIIHARSFVGAIPGAFLAKLFRLKFIYDLRGFWPDERVDGGIWKKDSLLYKVSKSLERYFILNSDHIVVLTGKAKRVLEDEYGNCVKGKIDVIPTCVDLDRFTSRLRCPVTDSTRFVFTYSGSIGTWYCLDEMADFFRTAKERISNAYFVFLTPFEERRIRAAMRARGFSEGDYAVKNLYPEEVPEWLSASDVSVFFIKPLFSKTSSCPTKFAESLACGVPVVINSRIGDCDEIVERAGIGVVVKDFSDSSYATAIDKILTIARDRDRIAASCRRAAEDHFSLEDGAERYYRIYERLR